MITWRRHSQASGLHRPGLREITLLACLALLLLTGCSSSRREGPVVFYPEPPQQPRIQYLTKFNDSSDIEKRGGLLATLSGAELGGKQLGKPYGVTIHEGVIYVADTAIRGVVKLDLENRRMEMLPSSGQGQLRKPVNLEVSEAGIIYVADAERSQVLAFRLDGEHVATYGDGELFSPVDVAIGDGKLYVADITGSDVKVLDLKSGEVLNTIGKRGIKPGEFRKPTNLWLDEEGNLYVTCTMNNQVSKFDPAGEFLSSFGFPGDGIGALARAKGVSVDRDGHVYVVDAAFENVQIFDQAGDVLLFFGGPGNQDGNLYLPASIHLDYDNLAYFQGFADEHFVLDYVLLVTNQFGPRKVSVFGFGHPEEGYDYSKQVKPETSPAEAEPAPAQDGES
jgi:hypothetical protein